MLRSYGNCRNDFMLPTQQLDCTQDSTNGTLDYFPIVINFILYVIKKRLFLVQNILSKAERMLLSIPLVVLFEVCLSSAH